MILYKNCLSEYIFKDILFYTAISDLIFWVFKFSLKNKSHNILYDITIGMSFY